MRDQEYDGKFLVTKFIKGRNLSADQIAQQYLINERTSRKTKRSNSVLLYMDIISFHPDDYEKLKDDSILKRITRRWIRKRAPHAMVTAVVHRNVKRHTHLHLAISGINYKSGESIRVTREFYKQQKLDIEQYQRDHFPFLKKSEIDHDKTNVLAKDKISDAEYKMEQKRGAVSNKTKILEVLEQAYASANTEQGFYKMLTQSNIELYTFRGKTVGIRLHGRKHRFRKLGYLSHTLKLLNQKDVTHDTRLDELIRIKDRQKGLSKDWER